MRLESEHCLRVVHFLIPSLLNGALFYQVLCMYVFYTCPHCAKKYCAHVEWSSFCGKISYPVLAPTILSFHKISHTLHVELAWCLHATSVAWLCAFKSHLLDALELPFLPDDVIHWAAEGAVREGWAWRVTHRCTLGGEEEANAK